MVPEIIVFYTAYMHPSFAVGSILLEYEMRDVLPGKPKILQQSCKHVIYIIPK